MATALAAPRTLVASALPHHHVAICLNCGYALKETQTYAWRHAKGGFIRCPEPRRDWRPGKAL